MIILFILAIFIINDVYLSCLDKLCFKIFSSLFESLIEFIPLFYDCRTIERVDKYWILPLLLVGLLLFSLVGWFHFLTFLLPSFLLTGSYNWNRNRNLHRRFWNLLLWHANHVTCCENIVDRLCLLIILRVEWLGIEWNIVMLLLVSFTFLVLLS